MTTRLKFAENANCQKAKRRENVINFGNEKNDNKLNTLKKKKLTHLFVKWISQPREKMSKVSALNGETVSLYGHG
jgi:hypothetical protein